MPGAAFLLSAFVLLVDSGPCTAFGLFLTDAAFFVALFYMFGLAFLFICILPSWHISNPLNLENIRSPTDRAAASAAEDNTRAVVDLVTRLEPRRVATGVSLDRDRGRFAAHDRRETERPFSRATVIFKNVSQHYFLPGVFDSIHKPLCGSDIGNLRAKWGSTAGYVDTIQAF